MNRLKQLQEQRGAKFKELEALRKSAENRQFTAEEAKKFDDLAKDIEALDSDIAREFRSVALTTAKAPELSRGEQRTVDAFDLGVALRASANLNGARLEGAELELVQEGAKEARDAGIGSFKGIMLPRAVCRRQVRAFRGNVENRDMTATGTTAVTGDQGGLTVATTPIGLLDAFYNADILEAMGITTYDGLVGNIVLPRFVRPTAPTHKAEQGAADELSPTMLGLSLSPCRLPAFADVTDQLLLQSNQNIRQFIEANIIRELRSLMQISLLHGSGAGNAPLGLAGTTGIGAVYAGGAASNLTNADGADPVYDDMVNFETAPADANADEGSAGYLFNTRLRGKLKRTLRAAGTDSLRIWDDRTGNMINGYRAFVTNAVSRTLTKGASNGVLSGGFFSPNWGDLVRAIWGGMNLELVGDTTSRKAGTYTIIGSVFYNGGAVRPGSFSYCADFKTV